MDPKDRSDSWGDMAAISGAFKTPAVLDAMEFLEKHGVSLEQDAKGARDLCEAKADSGDPAAKYVLACLYAYGFGGEKDSKHAVKLCEEAASSGYTRASLLLASLLISGEKASKEVLKEANCLLDEASKHGDLDARYCIALLALSGIGREQDRKFAVSEFESLSSIGYLDAKCALATELLKEGSLESEKRAIDLIVEAANADDPLANYLLANFYLSGIHGFPRDEEKSQFYMQKITKKS